jgi:hypothetical protein
VSKYPSRAGRLAALGTRPRASERPDVLQRIAPAVEVGSSAAYRSPSGTARAAVLAVDDRNRAAPVALAPTRPSRACDSTPPFRRHAWAASRRIASALAASTPGTGRRVDQPAVPRLATSPTVNRRRDSTGATTGVTARPNLRRNRVALGHGRQPRCAGAVSHQHEIGDVDRMLLARTNGSRAEGR